MGKKEDNARQWEGKKDEEEHNDHHQQIQEAARRGKVEWSVMETTINMVETTIGQGEKGKGQTREKEREGEREGWGVRQRYEAQGYIVVSEICC